MRRYIEGITQDAKPSSAVSMPGWMRLRLTFTNLQTKVDVLEAGKMEECKDLIILRQTKL